MITYTFLLNDIQILEPMGFADFVINVKRDPDTHGVMFESSAGELGFYGLASEMLQDLEEQSGFEALARLKIVATCGDDIDVLEGNLLFAKYRLTCGNQCIVYMPLEQTDCTLTLRNRIDQKVDMDKATSQDGITLLPAYAGLKYDLELPPQAIDTRSHARVKDLKDIGSFHTIDHPDTDLRSVDLRPSYETTIFDSIDVAEFIPSQQAVNPQPDDYGNVSPFLLFDDRVDCFGDLQFNYEFRLKGRAKVNVDCGGFHITLYLLTWTGEGLQWSYDLGKVVYQFNELYNVHPYTGNTWLEFDISWSGLIALGPGIGVYPYIRLDCFEAAIPDPTFSWEFDPETYGLIYKTRLCPPTNADVSLVNEAGSRIIESITDGCVRLKSDYYGRTDSQPYPSTQDGCGGLRVLTSGLKLRKAEKPAFFMSLGEYFQSLRAIDNVGWGIENDYILGGSRQWVRIEPVEYFYNDQQILEMPGIPDGQFELDPAYAYSQIDIGYQKWETERINGLQEFNSNKVYRTGLKAINNRLEALSDFVAAGQAIEVTRQQSFAESGAADTSYDNDTFIICVDRSGPGYIVERGNIGDPSNVFSPDTVYNWRIRPRYNLMRWWKTVIQSYKNLALSASRLFFGSGTGNLLAKGFLDDDCRLDAVSRAENEDLVKNDFLVPPVVIYQPNKLTFSYPLSLKDYLAIRSAPYGFIYAQCGTGEFVKGYILSVAYNINKGTAEISLLLKYNQQ